MTLQLMMMHHQTKTFCSLEDIIWTNINICTNNNILNHYYDLDLEHSNPFFSQDTLAYDDVPSDQVWLPKNEQFRRYTWKSHILIVWALTVTLTLKIANIFFRMALWLIMLHCHTKFGDKIYCGSKDIIQTYIHWHSEPLLWPWPWTQ